jgi:hypothetical protein
VAKSTRQEVYAAIDQERAFQDTLWPGRECGTSNPLKIGEFILLVEEYAAKARTAWTKEKAPEMEALDIVRKIAAIAVNCMEQHGAVPREGNNETPTSRELNGILSF